MLSTAALLLAASAAASMGSVKTAPFGTAPDGKRVYAITLTNASGASAKIATWGATLLDLRMPDKDGKMGSVVLGLDKLKPYEGTVPYFGATVGRFANRIAKGRFRLNGRAYNLAVNNGPNSLHGGLKGYDKRVWAAVPRMSAAGPSVKLSLVDEDGTEGYPGTVRVDVTYTLTANDILRIVYHATTTKSTPFNITNHSYFNLKDAGGSDVKAHLLHVYADRYTPTDKTLIPTGKLAPVAGTPFDFTSAKAIGKDIDKVDNGYDVNFAVNGRDFRQAAGVIEPTTGRVMTVFTDQPGIQLYTGGFLDGKIVGRNGAKYDRFHAFCLETQHFPDSPNQKAFPSSILRPGHPFVSTTEYRFGVVR